MMKFLFVHSGADLYGASRSLLRLTSRLIREGNAVTAVIPYEGPLRSALADAGVDVTIHTHLPVVTRKDVHSFGGVIKLLVDVSISVVQLGNLARRLKPDIMHTNTALILSPGIVARLLGIPHVWHVRESFSEFGSSWVWYQWFMWTFSTVIVCVSGSIARQFSTRIKRTRIAVIHNGFPKEEFAIVDPARVCALRTAYGLDNKILVGVVGRVKFVRKGQETFVKAASLLRTRFPAVQFLIIGSPFPGNEEHLTLLRELIANLGADDIVTYTGDVEDIKAAYSALDISVLPSGQPEPFGGVVVESMAFGKPVVGTRLGGTIEQIEDGVTGLLVDPGDASQLADAIGRLLEDPRLRARMGRKALERFEQLFEFERFYEKIWHIYQRWSSHG